MIQLLFVDRLFKKIIDSHPPDPRRAGTPFPGRGHGSRGGGVRTKPVVSVSRRAEKGGCFNLLLLESA